VTAGPKKPGRSHGFKSVMEFQRVTASITKAMAAAEMEGREDEMAANRAKMEEMKSQMTEEQYNAMIASQNAVVGTVTDSPDGNVALVKKWRDRLEAIGEN